MTSSTSRASSASMRRRRHAHRDHRGERRGVRRPDAALPAPATLNLPATPERARGRLEGMYVTLPQALTILEYFEYGRYGTWKSDSTVSDADRDRRAGRKRRSRSQSSRRWSGSPSTTELRCRTPTRCATRTVTSSASTNDLAGRRSADQRHGRPRLSLRDVGGPAHGGGATTPPANPRPEVPEVGGDLVCRELQRPELLHHDRLARSRERRRVRTTGGEDRRAPSRRSTPMSSA